MDGKSMGVVMTNEEFINLMHGILHSDCIIEVSDTVDFSFNDEERKEIQYWTRRYARHFSRFGRYQEMPGELHIIPISKRLKIDFGVCHIPDPIHLVTILKGTFRKYGHLSYNP